jgi:hypothetical protein
MIVIRDADVDNGNEAAAEAAATDACLVSADKGFGKY